MSVEAPSPPEDASAAGSAAGSAARLRELAAKVGTVRLRWLGGALLSVAVAVALYSRFSINILLNRDEAIYTYAGQQFSHGVPPYASIFDPKTPLESMIAGVAAAFAHAVGRDDVHVIRAAFFVCSCLTVLAVYVLAARLWRSVLGGLAAAVVFSSFEAFAHSALGGPDAKTPGVLLVVVSMWLLVRRRWFWGACAASLAFLVWQPFVFYGLVAVLVAPLSAAPRQRLRAGVRALAGVTIPLVATLVYFAAAGAFGNFVESTLAYPAAGVYRTPESVGTRIQHIFTVVHTYYAFSGILFWAGLIAMLLLVGALLVRGRAAPLRAVLLDPLICIVALTMVAEVGYACYDFQSYPDVFPLLVYPALGIGGLAAAAARVGTRVARRTVTAGILVAALVLTALSWSWFTNTSANNDDYLIERAEGCALNKVIVPGTPLYALGDPTPLVMTHRRNPDRFIYLSAGVDRWKIKHTTGGRAGWVAQILASHPSVIVIGGWNSPNRKPLEHALEQAGYSSGWVGGRYTLLTAAARERAGAAGVRVSQSWARHPLTTSGRRISCGNT